MIFKLLTMGRDKTKPFQEVVEVRVLIHKTVVEFRGMKLSDEAMNLIIDELKEYSLLEIKEGLRLLSLRRDNFNLDQLIEEIEVAKHPICRLISFFIRLIEPNSSATMMYKC